MEKKECALCRRDLAPGESCTTLTVGLNSSRSELVEETHEMSFCERPSEAVLQQSPRVSSDWPLGCAQKANELLDFFIERLWDLRVKDPVAAEASEPPTSGSAAGPPREIA